MEPVNNFKAGFVTIIGRPNVGKSTLLNAFLKHKLSIISPVPQTTRRTVRGILNSADAQIVFVDTPGLHSFKGNLAQHLNAIAVQALRDVDLVLYVVDLSRSPAAEEERIVKQLLSSKTNVIMALNKMDKSQDYINDYIDLWRSSVKIKYAGVRFKDPLRYYIPISAKTSLNLDSLMEAIKENLPPGVPFYAKDTITDFPLKFQVADVIRESLFLKLKEELPHCLAVEVRTIEDKEHSTYIEACIYVNRLSQKKIVIGRGGIFIRDAGIMSRLELEHIFAKTVYLDLRVKVVEDWQNKTRILQELGYETA